jgi:hypothetical protein
MRTWFHRCWLFAVLASMSACLPILPRETVVQPQPEPYCGDVKRPYQPPQPGPLLPPQAGMSLLPPPPTAPARPQPQPEAGQ